jgi:putative nucleotidyltransferase with HDIG domain
MELARPRVLVVDDDASILALVSEVVSEIGYEAVRAGSAPEALARVGEEPISAAVLDIGLPGINGIELARRIKLASPDTEILVLTGQGSLETAIEGIHHGIFDYLEKGSLKLPALERSVRQAVQRAQLQRQNRDLVEKVKDSNRLLTALHEMTVILAAESHLDRLLSRLVASAKELCDVESARVLLLGRTHDNRLVIETSVGDGAEPLRGMRLGPDEGITALVVEKDEAMLLPHASGHARYSPRSDEMPTRLPGFICAPLRHRAVRGTLTVAGRRAGDLGPEQRDLLVGLARQAAVAVDNAVQHERGINFFTHTCDMLVGFLERMDVFYPGHSRGVATLADMITRRLGLGEAERRSVHFAALLHDIGKLRLPAELLESKSGLSEEGRRLIQQHPVLSVEMLRPITLWEDVLPIIHGHHERWDGKGYPAGLAGEDIPLGARVVAVADVFDAMTRDTPYGPRRTPEEGLAELEAFAATQFDPRVVRLFVGEYRQRGDPLKP